MGLEPRRGIAGSTIEEIEQAAEGFKDDLTREGKRCVRRKNLDRALAVFMAEEYVDQFVGTLRMWAKSRQAAGEPKKRIRHISIPEEVRNLRPRKPPTKAEQHAREVAEASRFKGQPKRY